MKNLIYPVLIILAVLTQSCETDIPATDTTPPEFTFRITGDGFEYVFNPEDNYSNIQLNLKDGAEYDFIYTGSDDGGVKRIEWQLPLEENIQFTTDLGSTWSITTSGLSRFLKWTGNRNNPLTGNLIAGSFIAKGDNVTVGFVFSVYDFGGESGSANSVLRELNISINNQATELIQP